MRGLFLCGYGCKPWIWDKIKENWGSGELVKEGGVKYEKIIENSF